jgi:hypothetical protein
MVFPPCKEACDDADVEASSPNAAADGTASVNPSLVAAKWMVEAMEIPDYVAFLGTSRHERHTAHGLGLAMMLAPMVIMRLSVPTIAADFYDPFIFVTSMTFAPLIALPVYGWNMALGPQIAAAFLFAAVAALFVMHGVRSLCTSVSILFHLCLCLKCIRMRLVPMHAKLVTGTFTAGL